MVRDLEYELAPGASDTFEAYIDKRRTMPFFSNARTVRSPVMLSLALHTIPSTGRHQHSASQPAR